MSATDKYHSPVETTHPDSINHSTHHTKSTINALPPEIISDIMENLGSVFGVIFGLTCRQFYDEYKRRYPSTEPIALEIRLWNPDSPLDIHHPLFNRKAQLYELLGTWMGSGDTTKYMYFHLYFRDRDNGFSEVPKYSVAVENGGKFLLRSIYGKESIGSDHALRSLMIAWCAYNQIEGLWALIQHALRPGEFLPKYPSPSNMGGQKWIDEMKILAGNRRDLRILFRAVVDVAIESGIEKYSTWSAVEARNRQLEYEQSKRNK